MAYCMDVHCVAIKLNEQRIKGHEVYGIVKVKDQSGTVEIYNESKESCKSLLEDGTLRLTGPTRPIGISNTSLFVSLKDKHTDLEVSNGVFFLSASLADYWFNKTLHFPFGGYGGVTTLFATMFNNAIEVGVKVNLYIDPNCPQRKRAKITSLEDNSKSLHGIYGTMYAQITGEKGVHNCRTLFSNSADDPQPLHIDEIPLSRSRIVVPVFSSINIIANLWNLTDISGTHDQVAKWTAKFDDPNTSTIPEDTKVEEPVIKGEGVCFKVELTWHSTLYFGSIEGSSTTPYCLPSDMDMD